MCMCVRVRAYIRTCIFVYVHVNEPTKSDERNDIQFDSCRFQKKTEHTQYQGAYSIHVCMRAVRTMQLCWHSVFGARSD